MRTDKLVDIEFDGIDAADYPDFCDAFISSAYSEELNRMLTCDELDHINDNESDFVYEELQNYIF